MTHKVTEVIEDTFYGQGTLDTFVKEALSSRREDGFSAVIVVDKDFDDEWICKATVSYNK